MKRCFKCGEEKPAEAFCKRKRSGDGLQPRCKQCNLRSTALWKANNSARMAELDAKYDRRAKDRYTADPSYREKKKEAAKAWREKVGKEVIRLLNRQHHLSRSYGIAEADYDALVVKQDGRCACCGRRPRTKLVIDHDHDTGRVRGLLCFGCNVGLGLLGDSEDGLMRASRYLRAGQSQPTPFTFIE